MGKRISVFSEDVLQNLDATALGQKISNGEITAEQATQAAISRADKADQDLHGIVFKRYEEALAEANNNQQGVFAGVPTFVKDNDLVKGTPAQFGTGSFDAKVAKKNSPFVNQLKASGVNILGKTSLPEFGLLCSTENPKWGITRNPWNTDYTTGGSSSGSGALVASGVVPIATANDGAGSIRIPASCCGLVGLKPSRRRIYSFEGADKMPIDIVYQGILSRSVRDTAHFFEAAEKHYTHPGMQAIGPVTGAGEQRLKIAYFERIEKGKPGRLDDDVHETVINSVNLLKQLGHQVEELPFPMPVEAGSDHFLNYYGMMSFLFQNFGRLMVGSKVHKSELEPFTIGVANQFKKNLFQVPKSIKRLREIATTVESSFSEFDIIMTPVLSKKTPKIGYLGPDLSYDEIKNRLIDLAPFTCMQNISGSPAISLPMGICSNGLPIGLQFVAPHGRDKRLLELAFEIESAQPWPLLYA